MDSISLIFSFFHNIFSVGLVLLVDWDSLSVIFNICSILELDLAGFPFSSLFTYHRILGPIPDTMEVRLCRFWILLFFSDECWFLCLDFLICTWSTNCFWGCNLHRGWEFFFCLSTVGLHWVGSMCVWLWVEDVATRNLRTENHPILLKIDVPLQRNRKTTRGCPQQQQILHSHSLPRPQLLPVLGPRWSLCLCNQCHSGASVTLCSKANVSKRPPHCFPCYGSGEGLLIILIWYLFEGQTGGERYKKREGRDRKKERG